MDKFSDLLSLVINKSHTSLSHSCEPELIELMRQIDAMIEEKRKEWEMHISKVERENNRLVNKNETLQNELRSSKYELHRIQTSLLQKESEIIHVKPIHYDDQVTQLKEELSTLKRNYHKLLRKASNRRRVGDQEVILNNECCDVKTQEYKTTIDVMESQQKTLLTKCERMQKQLLSYQTELNKSKMRFEKMEDRNSKEFNDLEKQLKVCQEKLSKKDENIIRNASDEKKIIELEESLATLSNRLDTKICELQVCSAQIEALQLENTHLRNLLRHHDKHEIHDVIDYGREEEENGYILENSIVSSISSSETESSMSSRVDAFIKDEKLREKQLNNRILSCINEFDRNVNLLKK